MPSSIVSSIGHIARAYAAQVGRSFSRSTSLAPLQAWLTGGDTDAAGYSAARLADAYSQVPVVFRCVLTVANALVAAPFELYEGSRRVTSGPWFELFAQPNEHADWEWFVTQLAVQCQLSGNADILIGRLLPNGVPRDLRLARPYSVEPKRDPHDEYVLQGWAVTGRDGSRNPLPPEAVARIRYAPSADPLVGIGPLTAARVAAETDYAAAIYGRQTLRQGGTPPGLLKYKTLQTIAPELMELIRQEWMSSISGPMNAGRVAVLTGDFDYEQLGWNPRDMEFVVQRRWSREELGMAFDVPLFFLNVERSHGLGDASATAEAARLYTSNVIPFSRRIVAPINRFLRRLTDGRLQCVQNFDQIESLQPSMEKRSALVSAFIAAGFTRNEINDRLDLGFDVNSDWGDDALVSAGFTTARAVVVGSTATDNFDKALAVLGETKPANGETDIALDETNGGDGETKPAVAETGGDDIAIASRSVSASADRAFRQRLWLRQHGAALDKLEATALGRLRNAWLAQRRRVVKELTRRRPAGTSLAEAVDAAPRAFRLGTTARALQPVAWASFADGWRSAERDLDTARCIKPVLTRADAATASESPALSAEFDVTSDGIEIVGSGEFVRIDVPADLLPTGTEKIARRLYEARFGVEVSIDERIVVQIGETLRAGWEEGESLRELKLRITSYFDVLSESRAKRIVRTETGTFRNNARFEKMREQGVERVEWLAEIDERTRDSHRALDGEVRALGEEFKPKLRHPHDMDAPAGEVINCRCTLLPLRQGLSDTAEPASDTEAAVVSLPVVPALLRGVETDIDLLV